MTRLLTTGILLLLLHFSAPAIAQQKLSGLRFIDTENGLVTAKNIPKGKALLLIYFRSDCDHCVHASQKLKESAAHYPAVIWMVSAEPLATLRTFEDMTGFYDVSNLTVLQDHTQSMHTWFDFTQLPFIVLFDKNGKQLKTFSELPAVETVKKFCGGK